MKKIASMIVFAIVGVAICFCVILVTEKLQLTPKFPSFAGEDDFEIRIMYFLLTVCPGFAAIGAWIGHVFALNKSVAGWMWGGVIAGSVATFSFTHALSPIIGNISSRDTANYGVLGLFVFWLLFSALGAWVARFAFRGE